MIDYEKFVKYSKPGPRYTSYPTAPEFSENFKEENLKDAYAFIEKNKDLYIAEKSFSEKASDFAFDYLV